MVIRDKNARVEMWVSDFCTHDGADGYYWEWSVHRYDGQSRRMKEFACGFEKSQSVAMSKAEKTFEFCGGSL